MQEEVILDVRNITKSFGMVKVLQGVNCSFNRGECHAICGENGAGKSTLMKILSGAYSKDNGEIFFEGAPLEISSPHDAQKKGISIIYQELSLIPTLSAAENLYLGRLLTSGGRVDWKEMEKRATEYFAQVDLHIDPWVPTRNLTVAQCQLIEIARSLICSAKVVIMDEPTSSLSDKETAKLFEIIRRFRDRGVTIIYISHKLEEIFTICDRVTVLKDGEFSGTREIGETSEEEVISLMVGRSLDQYYPKHRKPASPEVLFEAKNLVGGPLVQNVSFQVHRGEILGFAGLVGAGRTETMRVIFGADPLKSGELYMHGKKLSISSPREAIANKLAFATEDRRDEGLVLNMSVRENTTLASYKRFSSRRVINSAKERELAQHYMDLLRVRATSMEQKTMFLSGGNQQKVVVSKWLSAGAELFIFDEPTRGIDVGAKAEIYQLIVDLAESGKGIIVVSSELPEVMGVSDRIIVMHEGAIAGTLSHEDFSEEKIMALALRGV